MDVPNATIDNLTLGTATSLNINPGDSFSLASGTSPNRGTFANYGTFNNNSDSGFFSDGNMNNYGVVNNSGALVSLGEATNNGTIINSGSIGADVGSLTNNKVLINMNNGGLGAIAGGSIYNNGTIINSSGSSISLDVGSYFFNSGTVINSGTFFAETNDPPANVFIGNFINESSGSFYAAVVDSGGTVVNNGGFSLACGILGYCGSVNSGTFINNGTLDNSGAVPGAPGCISGSTCAFNNTGTIINQGIFSNMASGVFNNRSGANLMNAGTINNSGVFTNSGAVTISNSGLFTTSTNYTQTAGRTTVDGTLAATNGAIVDIQGGKLGGTGTINGNVLVAGTMMPGDAPGTLTIIGNYEQAGTGIFAELMSPYAQAFLDVSGNVVLDPGATLDITLLGGFNPLGDRISIMDFSTLSGQFANGSSFWDDNYLWDITYRQHEVDVTAVQAPEPGTLSLLGVALVGLVLYRWRNWARSLRRPCL